MKLKQQILSAVMLAASTGAQATKTNFDNLQAGYSGYGDHFASGSFLDKVSSGPDTIISMNGGDHDGGIKGRSAGIFESGTERGARNIETGKYHSDWRERAYHYQTRTRCISPVPEPGVWNFLVAGLAMIGFISYRRRDMTACK